MNKLFLGMFILTLGLYACKPQSDSKKIIGKWQSDDDWFEYFENNSYNSGRAYIEMVKGFKYSIDEQKKELNMYTDDKNQTYYLEYEFVGNDTLRLNNILNTKTHFATFYRVKDKKK